MISFAVYDRMTVDIELLLTWLPALYLWREKSVELLDSFFVITELLNIAGIVEPFSSVKSAVLQHFYKKRSREEVTLEANVVFAAAFIAPCNVVIGIAEVDNSIVTHIGNYPERVLKKSFSAAFSLIFGKHAKWPHSDDLFFVAVFISELSLAVHNTADDLSVNFDNIVEFGDKVLMLSHYMYEVVLMAAGLAEVPESFTGKIFNFTVVLFRFSADDIVIFIHYFFPPEIVDRTREVCVG